MCSGYSFVLKALLNSIFHLPIKETFENLNLGIYLLKRRYSNGGLEIFAAFSLLDKFYISYFDE